MCEKVCKNISGSEKPTISYTAKDLRNWRTSERDKDTENSTATTVPKFSNREGSQRKILLQFTSIFSPTLHNVLNHDEKERKNIFRQDKTYDYIY